jgi:RNA polymerase sigma-70 factor (ECF subfamily)
MPDGSAAAYYLRVFSSASTFRGEASLGTWLARVVINEALRRARGQRAAVDLASLAESLAADHPGSITMAPSAGPEHAAAHAEIRRLVEQAVSELPAPFRVVFMMRVIEQMSIKETAAVLAIPPATVKTRLHRALQDHLLDRMASRSKLDLSRSYS